MMEDPWAELERSNQLNVRSSRSETNESLSRLENDAESDSNVCSNDEDNPGTTTEISFDEC